MRRLIHLMTKAEELVAGLAYIAMTALIAGEVIVRELFHATIFGSEKMAILASVVAGFVGFALATRSNRHLRISAFDGLIPPHWKAAHQRLADFVSVALLLMLAWFALEFVLESLEFSERVEVLYIPRWPFQAVIVYALLSSALHHLVFLIYPEERPLDELAALHHHEGGAA